MWRGHRTVAGMEQGVIKLQVRFVAEQKAHPEVLGAVRLSKRCVQCQ